jgi:chromosomal replication initiation ATPase DnaA
MSAVGLQWVVEGSVLPPRPQAPTVAMIIDVVADDYGLTAKQTVSMQRGAAKVRARQVSMWLARRLTSQSFPQIARQFGDRDHTTVMHGCSRIDELMLVDADLAERVIRLMSAITEGMAAVTSPPKPVRLVPQKPSMDTIIRIVAGHFSVSETDILSERQDDQTVLARHSGMWLARRLTSSSFSIIGRRFCRYHRTVAYAVERIDTMMGSDPELGQHMLSLMDCLTLPRVAA